MERKISKDHIAPNETDQHDSFHTTKRKEEVSVDVLEEQVCYYYFFFFIFVLTFILITKWNNK